MKKKISTNEIRACTFFSTTNLMEFSSKTCPKLVCSFLGIFAFIPYDHEEQPRIYPEMEVQSLWVHSTRTYFSLLIMLWNSVVINHEAFQIFIPSYKLV